MTAPKTPKKTTPKPPPPKAEPVERLVTEVRFRTQHTGPGITSCRIVQAKQMALQGITVHWLPAAGVLRLQKEGHAAHCVPVEKTEFFVLAE